MSSHVGISSGECYFWGHSKQKKRKRGKKKGKGKTLTSVQLGTTGQGPR